MTIEEYIVERTKKLEEENAKLKEQNDALKKDLAYETSRGDNYLSELSEYQKEFEKLFDYHKDDGELATQYHDEEQLWVTAIYHLDKEKTPNIFEYVHKLWQKEFDKDE